MVKPTQGISLQWQDIVSARLLVETGEAFNHFRRNYPLAPPHMQDLEWELQWEEGPFLFDLARPLYERLAIRSQAVARLRMVGHHAQGSCAGPWFRLHEIPDLLMTALEEEESARSTHAPPAAASANL